jgi:hypothetical protein
MLLKRLGLVEDIVFVHPQDGQVEIGPGDITHDDRWLDDELSVDPG